MKKTHYRAVWLSDIHLGCKDCKADYLLDFLNHSDIEHLYLVGDIVDMWAMSKQFRWPDSHNQVLHHILSLSHSGTKVMYLPGNHDEPIQKYDGMDFGEVKIKREHVHVTAKGKKLLLLHGDQFDQEVCFGAMHAWIGDKAYDLLLFINRWYNWLRIRSGKNYWSLAGYIKSHIKGANTAIQRYRQACCNRARDMKLDGVVCGHIHHPEIYQDNEITYLNDGDWIENCTALVESQQGDLSLLHWSHVKANQNLYEVPNVSKTKSKRAA